MGITKKFFQNEKLLHELFLPAARQKNKIRNDSYANMSTVDRYKS